MTGQLDRLLEVVHALRQGCPWDAGQTHHSLLHHLVEETAEVVDAVETGTDADLREELGDLLLQVVFHCEIASEREAFTMEEVAGQISDKLVARHPYVFSDAPVPDDLNQSWEQRKRAEKARRSALDGIPVSLPVLARAAKVIARSRAHEVAVSLPDEPLDEAGYGAEVLALTARAQAGGVDPEQALRSALRRLEADVHRAETGA
ncbi:MAG: MazG family protein [Actinomycetia bacterium]|mgnify:CR=1 FL=1|nr:MazG family protein [Actinomycetes bacterium]